METGPLTCDLEPEPLRIHLDPWRHVVADNLQFGKCAMLHERPEHLLTAHLGTVPLDLADGDVKFPGREFERSRDIRTGR
jgi:hypothetical protein